MAAGAGDEGRRVCVGQIGAPHGVRGLVRIRAFTENPDDVASYGPVVTESGRTLVLSLRSAKKGVLIAAVEGIESREQAVALRGERLYVGRGQLPPPDDEEWYLADLVGLAVVGSDGRPLGRVAAVHDFGAGDILEIDPGESSTVFVPFARSVVPVVDISAGRLVIEHPEAYFESGDGGGEQDR